MTNKEEAMLRYQKAVEYNRRIEEPRELNRQIEEHRSSSDYFLDYSGYDVARIPASEMKYYERWLEYKKNIDANNSYEQEPYQRQQQLANPSSLQKPNISLKDEPQISVGSFFSELVEKTDRALSRSTDKIRTERHISVESEKDTPKHERSAGEALLGIFILFFMMFIVLGSATTVTYVCACIRIK